MRDGAVATVACRGLLLRWYAFVGTAQRGFIRELPAEPLDPGETRHRRKGQGEGSAGQDPLQNIGKKNNVAESG